MADVTIVSPTGSDTAGQRAAHFAQLGTHTSTQPLPNPDCMSWPIRVANLSWPPNGSWWRLEASVPAQVGASLFAPANILVALTRSDML